jgi:hypothetical protein
MRACVLKNNPGGLSRCGKRSRCLRLAPQAGLRQRPSTHSSHTTSIVTTLRNGTLVKYTSIRESSQCPPKVGSAVVRLAGPARGRCITGEKFTAVNSALRGGTKVGSAVVRLAGPARGCCITGEKFTAVNSALRRGTIGSRRRGGPALMLASTSQTPRRAALPCARSASL